MALFKKENKKTSTQVSKVDATDLGWVLKSPRITEKTATLMEKNLYVFLVDKKANRAQIKQAVRAVYGVVPVSVNIITMAGRHIKKRGRKMLERGYKKAIVKLSAKDTIEIV